MNFLVMSDLHLEYQDLDLVVPDEAEAVILAGDIAQGDAGIYWAREVFGDLPVFYVPGNHEFYGREVGEIARAMHSAAALLDVVLLEKTSAQLPEIRVLGTTLWTGFDLFAGDDEVELAWAKADARRYVPDFDGRIRCFAEGYSVPLTPEITQRWHIQAKAWLAEQLAIPFAGKTLVVTHHAPSIRSVPACYAKHPATPAWASPLEAMMEKADVWVHGHVHQSCDYEVAACRVVCNPRGYEGEAENFNSAYLLRV